MTLWARFRSWLGATWQRPRMESEMDAELRFHLEAYADDLVRSGLPRHEALRRAHMEFGGIESAKEECREARGVSFFETLTQDLRHGARMLRKNPGFTTIAIFTLALGIGANTAIFSVIDAVLFRPLPVNAPHELVDLYNNSPGEMFEYAPLSYPDYIDFRDNNKTLGGLLGFAPNFLALERNGESEMVSVEAVTGNYFDVLGVKPVLGRTFDAAQDAAPGGYPFVVLSYTEWQRKFNADPAIMGKTVRLNGHILTILGVAPRDFSGLMRGLSPALWVPITMDSTLHMGDPLPDRGSQWLFVTGRLNPGVSAGQTQAELATVASRLALQYPKSNHDRTAKILPASQVKIMPEVDGALYAASYVVIGFVGLILLIACANLAGMLLARASVRRKEIALRVALGAGRLRLIRQLLTESLLLAVLGGALGLFLTVFFDSAVSGALQGMHLGVPIQLGLTLSLDTRVFVFTLIAVTAATLLFGLVPAFKASNVAVNAGLKEETVGSGGSRSKHRTLKFLVVGQMATSLLLLICAGLSVRSMQNAFRVDPGFKPDGVITSSFYPSLAGMNGPQAASFYEELTARVRSLPGVQSVGLTERLPLTFVIQVSRCAPQGKDTVPIEQWQYVDRSGAGPGYFQTMQIPILQGREFMEADTSSSPLVVIVNQALANLFWPGQDAIGHKVRFGDDEKYAEVVGVARDGKYRTLGEQARPFIYRPVQQQGNPDLILLTRVTGDPHTAFAALREALFEFEHKVPVMQLESLNHRISISLLLPRAGASLFGLLGLLGLVLASVGLYGVIAYTTSQRTHEIGIRMTLGAKPQEILHLILRQGLILAAVGIAAGLAGALAMTRLLSVMLYGVSATDTMTFVGISLFLLLVSLLASYFPARRAMRVDPMVALRHE
jgi:macrolide transport system ATP-binding/permease protein